MDAAALTELATELAASRQDVGASLRGLPLPVRFASVAEELNLLALFHLLDFGSGYLTLPEQQRLSGGRSMRDALLYGILGLHLSGTKLDAVKLKCVGTATGSSRS